MERRKTISFLDLDRTLYRTDEFLRSIQQDLVNRGYSLELINKHLASLGRAGDYTFEQHLQLLGMSREQIAHCVPLYREIQKRGDTHLYDDVPQLFLAWRKLARAYCSRTAIPTISAISSWESDRFRDSFGISTTSIVIAPRAK